MNKWLVFAFSDKHSHWECVDEVFFTRDYTADQVLESLVKHDNFPDNIQVFKAA